MQVACVEVTYISSDVKDKMKILCYPIENDILFTYNPLCKIKAFPGNVNGVYELLVLSPPCKQHDSKFLDNKMRFKVRDFVALFTV